MPLEHEIAYLRNDILFNPKHLSYYVTILVAQGAEEVRRMDCIFCKIVKNEIPSKKVYEDDSVLAFYDINPVAPIHILVVPKKHIASINEISLEDTSLIGHIHQVIVDLAKVNGLDSGFRVVNNCGAEGGQTVGHLHFHLLGGRNLQWPPG